MDGAGAHQHLPSGIGRGPVRFANRHAGHARAVQHQPLHSRVGHDGQVRPAPGLGIHIPHRRRHALRRRVVHRHRGHAVAEEPVEVGVEGIARILHLGRHGLDEGWPAIALVAADRNRAVLAVKRAVEIPIVLQPVEVGQHIAPAPAFGPEAFPLVEIGRQPALGHHAHDAGAAPHQAPLGKLPRKHGTAVAGVGPDLRRQVLP